MTPEQRITLLEKRLNHIEKSQYYTFQKDLQLLDGRNIILNTGTGTQIATATGQKLGFYGITPVIQQIVDARSIIDLGSVVAVCDSMRNKLRLVGIIA